jgi:hypothetical protein
MDQTLWRGKMNGAKRPILVNLDVFAYGNGVELACCVAVKKNEARSYVVAQ